MSNPFEHEVINHNEEKLILSDINVEQLRKRKRRMVIAIILSLICLMLGCLITFLVIGLSKKDTQKKSLIEILFTKEQLAKSSIDERDFRIVKLPNGLIATLISDLKAKSYSAGMEVRVGFQQDGEIKGLAHFTEHMLFIGSEKYPEVDGFMSYVTQNGGNTNAGTDSEITVYHFTVLPSGFDKALDMFCRMFNETLLKEEYIEKEINAVNSEFLMYLNQDQQRASYLIASLLGAIFPIGSTESLKEKGIPELLKQVKRLIKQYYVADNMQLVIIANESLDDLQTKAYNYFGYLSNSTNSKNDDSNESQGSNSLSNGKLSNENSFAFHSLGEIGWVEKLSNEASIDFAFAYPVLDFKADPLDFINYLLKDYNKGSFHNKFIENSYISSFKILEVRNITDHIEFYLHYVLTQKGMDNIEEFIRQFFSYINKLRDKPIDQTLFEEYKRMSVSKFKFSIPYENIFNLASRMGQRKSNLTYLLYEEPSITAAYNGKLIQEALNYFSVDNCIILVGSNEDMKKLKLQNMVENYETFFDAKTDYYFKTKYNTQKINKDFLEVLKTIKDEAEFAIRNSNIFITEQKHLISCNDSKEVCKKEFEDHVPIPIISLENCHIYYKLDRSFKLPRVIAQLRLIYQGIRSNDPNEYTQSKLFVSYLQLEAQNQLHDAQLSGNSIEILNEDKGILIKINAFSDLIVKIANAIFTIISKPSISEEKYKSLVEKVKIMESTLDQAIPHEIARHNFNRIMKPDNKFPYGKITDEYAVVKEHLDTFSKHIIIDVLFTGCITEKSVIEIYEKTILGVIDNSSTKIAQELKVLNSKEAIKYLQSHFVLQGSYVHRQKANLPTEENHAIVNYYYIGNYGTSYERGLKGLMLLLSWGSIFFEKLRTEQQLGYVVASKLVNLNHNFYYEIAIQGNKKNPKEMDVLIDEVINLIREKIKGYTKEDLAELRVNAQAGPSSTLDTKSNFMFGNILSQETKLDRYDDSAITKSVDLPGLSELFEDVFYTNPKKLSIQIFNKNTVSLPFEPEKYNLNKNIQSVLSESFDLVKDKQ